MLKPLTKEGRFEAGIDEAISGKLAAFVPAISSEHHKIILGIAIANEPGYIAVPISWCNADTWPEMSTHCDDLNAELGLSVDAALKIVSSSMAAGSVHAA
jgi:hypothetical protein